MRKFKFYCARHPDYEGDEEEGQDKLTKLGYQQIAATTEAHLKKHSF